MSDERDPVSVAFHLGAAEDELKEAKAHLELAMQALKNEEALRAEVRAGRQFRRQVRDELRAWLDDVTCAQLYLALGITHEEQADG